MTRRPDATTASNTPGPTQFRWWSAAKPWSRRTVGPSPSARNAIVVPSNDSAWSIGTPQPVPAGPSSGRGIGLHLGAVHDVHGLVDAGIEAGAALPRPLV